MLCCSWRKAKTAASAARETTIELLSDDLLCEIFSMLPQARRQVRDCLCAMTNVNANGAMLGFPQARPSVEQTCSRWRNLVDRPEMWHRLAFKCHFARYNPSPEIATLALLQRRSRAAHELKIKAGVSDPAGPAVACAFFHVCCWILSAEAELVCAQIVADLQEHTSVDGLVQNLILAVTPAPALQTLVLHLPSLTSVSLPTLVRVHATSCMIGMCTAVISGEHACLIDCGHVHATSCMYADVIRMLAGARAAVPVADIACHGLRAPVHNTDLDALFEGLPALQACSLRFDRDRLPAQEQPTAPQSAALLRQAARLHEAHLPAPQCCA